MQGTVKLLLLVSALGLSACGGSSGDSNREQIQDDAAVSNAVPNVSAGNDVTVELVDHALLKGSVTDDDLPNNVLTVTWSRIAGPSSAIIATPNARETKVSFEEVGTYRFSLLGDDGAASNRDEVEVTVINTATEPTGNVEDSSNTDTPVDETDGGASNESADEQTDSEEPVDTESSNEESDDEEEPSQPAYETKEHSSGLRLEYIKSNVLADSTDIDWMYRMWGGVAQCQNLGATTAYPTIRLSAVIATPEAGDLLSEGESNLYRMNLEKEFIEVLNSGTSPNAGTNQGLILAEAMSWYMGFQENDNWPGSDCASWHSGGRHHPSPLRPGIGNVEYLYERSLSTLGQVFTVKSDTLNVDEFALGYVGDVWESVAKCHGYTETKPAAIKEIVVVTDRSGLFSGDRWNDTGSYSVNDGGQIVINSTDLVNIRTNKEWGQGLHHWINAYLDAYADRFHPYYECRDLTSLYNETVLPIQLD